MKLSQFKFKLPEEQIALYPHSIWHEFKNEQGENETFRITRRDECRLMVLHRKSQTIDMYKRDENGNPIQKPIEPEEPDEVDEEPTEVPNGEATKEE